MCVGKSVKMDSFKKGKGECKNHERMVGIFGYLIKDMGEGKSQLTFVKPLFIN